jgi:hypothetical protein
VFTKIAAAASAKEAWTTLKTAFQGNSKVLAIRLQGMRREFETLNMNQGESVQAFLTRVTSTVNQIKSCGDDITEKIVVMKVLSLMAPRGGEYGAYIYFSYFMPFKILRLNAIK